MVDLANEHGGQDNLTAVLALVEGGGLPLANEEERAAPTLEILQEYKYPG